MTPTPEQVKAVAAEALRHLQQNSQSPRPQTPEEEALSRLD